LALHADGKIVAVGRRLNLITGAHFGLARYEGAPKLCLRNSARGDVVQFNTSTGAYTFVRCSDGLTLSGGGTVRTSSGVVAIISDSQTQRRLSIGYYPNQLTARLVINLTVSQGVSQTIIINGAVSTDGSCACTH